MRSVGRCPDIGALPRRSKRRNFAVEEIAAHAHDEEDYVSGQQKQLGLLVGGLRFSVSLWKSERFLFPPKKILNGNLSAAAAHPN